MLILKLNKLLFKARLRHRLWVKSAI